MLKYAANKDKNATAKRDANSSYSENEDFSKFGSKAAQKAEKDRRKAELEKLRAEGKDDVGDKSGAIRLPNRISKGLQIDP